MDYENFLANCPQDDLRRKIWELFNLSEPRARWFVLGNWKWVDIVSVKSHTKKGGNWHSGGTPYATIEIYTGWDDLGVIFHEIFHSAFARSPLAQNKVNCEGDDDWGNGFCNAFRWFMETQHLKKSHWLEHFRKAKKSFKILTKCGRDYEKFKEYWVYLNQHSDTVLDSFFC